ncbi:unnamed protein product [Brachionus calyciflorus]|uniref:Uncharacterized protein n=1 Tax=Brachionus calyciflorus TaxID=104777 RepID=A0A814LUU7_9BILA|nr:unnamed protein product [Brachionus calyciflorus]
MISIIFIYLYAKAEAELRLLAQRPVKKGGVVKNIDNKIINRLIMKKTVETNLKKNQLNSINRSIKKKYNKINKSLRKMANRVSSLVLENSLEQPRGSGDDNPRKNLQQLYTFRHIPNQEYKDLKDTLTAIFRFRENVQ